MTKLKIQQVIRVVAAMAVVGLVSVPVAASAATDTTTVNVTVDSAITVTTSDTVAISIVPTEAGAEATGNDTVEVDTNDPDGYTLTLNNSDATLSLTGAGTAAGDSVGAASGTFGAPAALETNSWGYRIASFTAGAYSGVKASEQAETLKTTSAVATDDQTTVTYGVKMDTTKKAGTYSDQVTYTATAR